MSILQKNVYPPKKSEAGSNFGGAAVGGACGDRQPPESWASTRHVRCVGRAATRRQMNEASIRAWHAIQLYVCNHSQTTLSVNCGGTAVSPHSLQISIWHCHGALRSCHLRAAQAVAVAMHMGKQSQSEAGSAASLTLPVRVGAELGGTEV